MGGLSDKDLEGVPRAGDVLLDKYRVDEVLGAGGMGVVVAATHLALAQRVAIKFLLAKAAKNPNNLARFTREARAAARIQSDHVARVTDTGSLADGTPYIVMEYLDGEDVAHRLRSVGSLPLQTALRLILQTCEAVAEAHARGIVHRDLKPANLFLARRPDGSERIKVVDFGISKIVIDETEAQDEAALTRTAALMGSPLYMSPEQMRSARQADSRADIWAIGCILFEMLAGKPPFKGATLPEVCSKILTDPTPSVRALAPATPEPVELAVYRCLAKEPADRYQDLAALAVDLAPWGGAEAAVSCERISRVLQHQGSADISGKLAAQRAQPSAEPSQPNAEPSQPNAQAVENSGPQAAQPDDTGPRTIALDDSGGGGRNRQDANDGGAVPTTVPVKPMIGATSTAAPLSQTAPGPSTSTASKVVAVAAACLLLGSATTAAVWYFGASGAVDHGAVSPSPAAGTDSAPVVVTTSRMLTGTSSAVATTSTSTSSMVSTKKKPVGPQPRRPKPPAPRRKGDNLFSTPQ